ncbi:hypothetical protein NQ318_012958 [Aromia moschata]|uniref:C-type lectin domain-containing protein n=1 Tax=Aromia moschata TaxID=1265417 RepID=A0AAV8XND7_9CUCU|nr:hypothetical protein NQ318_012958 [Aromia moschata]
MLKIYWFCVFLLLGTRASKLIGYVEMTESEKGTVLDAAPRLHLQKLGNTYYYFGTVFKVNYFQALQFCNSENMSLLSVESLEESDFLFQRLRAFFGGTDYRFWTSGTILPDDTNWVWLSTGNPIIYTNWLPKQPDNTRNDKCLELRYGNNLMWNDVTCTTSNLVICEVTPPKDNSRILTSVANCNLTLINAPPE